MAPCKLSSTPLGVFGVCFIVNSSRIMKGVPRNTRGLTRALITQQLEKLAYHGMGCHPINVKQAYRSPIQYGPIQYHVIKHLPNGAAPPRRATAEALKLGTGIGIDVGLIRYTSILQLDRPAEYREKRQSLIGPTCILVFDSSYHLLYSDRLKTVHV
jgi:hypothetical protein